MEVEQKSSTKATKNEKILQAILHPQSNSQMSLKVYFEIAFQNHIARWIYHQAKMTHMQKYLSRTGLSIYWFNDAIRNICPKCLKQQFTDIWSKRASADEKKEMAVDIKYILSIEFDVMELLMEKQFLKNMQDIINCIPYPDSKYPACTC